MTTEPQLYGPDNLGGFCGECGRPIPATIPDQIHPTCDPDWPPMLAASKRATRRQEKTP